MTAFLILIDFVCFFFCKQKTAYEMRISDWSSDVCSSDLPAERHAVADDSMAVVPHGLRLPVGHRVHRVSRLPGLKGGAFGLGAILAVQAHQPFGGLFRHPGVGIAIRLRAHTRYNP